MGINSNGLKLGTPVPAQASYQARAGGSSGSVRDDQATQSDQAAQAGASPGRSTGAPGANPPGNGATGSGATGSGTTAGGKGQPGSSGAASNSQATPSAQTRSARAARAATTAARAQAAAVAGNGQAATVTVDADADTSGDFGSVMATALGRSTAAAPATAAPAKSDPAVGPAAAATATDPTNSAPAGDAVAWIAQVMNQPTTPRSAAVGALPDTSATATLRPAAPGVGAVTAATGAAKPAVAAGASADATVDDAQVTDAAAPAALSAGQPATTGATAIRRGRTETPSVVSDQPKPLTPQIDQATQAVDDASVPTAAGQPAAGSTVNGLAQVQARIAGLSDPAAATDVPAGTTHSALTASTTDTSQVVAALQANSIGRSSAAGENTLTIKAAVGSTEFANEVGSAVTGLAQSGVTQAQLQLNPADLGPVQVHITLQSGQASVWFSATHADTRVALEQSLPRLRELFAGSGLSLSDSGVFRERPQQQQTQPAVAPSPSSLLATDTAATAPVTQVSNVRLSLLDTYA